jgi:hypothetical protein
MDAAPTWTHHLEDREVVLRGLAQPLPVEAGVRRRQLSVGLGLRLDRLPRARRREARERPQGACGRGPGGGGASGVGTLAVVRSRSPPA